MVDSIHSSVGSRKLAELQARVTSMEKTIMAIAQSVNQAVSELGDTLTHVQAVLDATTSEVGKDVIQARLDATALEQRRADVERAKAKLRELEVNGKIVKTDTVEEGVIVVGREVDKDGNLLPPEYVQFNMDPDVEWYENVKSLLGKGVGARTEIPPDGTFVEVTALYKKLPEQQQQAQAAG